MYGVKKEVWVGSGGLAGCCGSVCCAEGTSRFLGWDGYQGAAPGTDMRCW